MTRPDQVGTVLRRWLPPMILAAALLTLVTLAVVLASNERKRGAADGEAVILAVNDIYRIDGVDRGSRGGMARLRALRAELEVDHPDLIMLHAGDFLFPSLLSDTYLGEQMIDLMNLLDGDSGRMDDRLLVTFGNHEFDPLPRLAAGQNGDKLGSANLAARIDQSRFHWLGSNVQFADSFRVAGAKHHEKVLKTRVVESGGLRVGLFSLTLDETRPDYVLGFLDTVTTAYLLTRELREEHDVDVVIALTHLSIDQDRELLRRLGPQGPDLIVGGHEHERHAEEIDGRWVVKADADARSAAVVRIRRATGGPLIAVSYRLLGPDGPAPDRETARRVADWLDRHQRAECGSSGCLDRPAAVAEVELVAEEAEIRRFETNFGNWIADQVREELGVQVAFINSGALRLNQSLPAGNISKRDLLELVGYRDGTLVRFEITGQTLQRVINHSVGNWTGAGHFLQISGFAFRHDPCTGHATDLVLLTPQGPRSVDPQETITAATLSYLQGGGNRYDCLGTATRVEDAGTFLALLEKRMSGNLNPQIEGRICNSERTGRPCLVPDLPPRDRLSDLTCAEDDPADAPGDSL